MLAIDGCNRSLVKVFSYDTQDSATNVDGLATAGSTLPRRNAGRGTIHLMVS